MEQSDIAATIGSRPPNQQDTLLRFTPVAAALGGWTAGNTKPDKLEAAALVIARDRRVGVATVRNSATVGTVVPAAASSHPVGAR